jgi:hypothetical protein
MRSFGFTLILALLAVVASAVASWQWIEGNFHSVLGAPATPVGARIYTGFSPPDVKSIRVSQNGISANFELGPNGWQAKSPWTDRMDPRAAVSIINFTLGMRVEDLAEVDKVDPQKAGLRESGINIRIEGENNRPLAKYKLGRQTPWLATVEGIEGPVPTVFIQPRDEDHKRYVYACTGDILPLFKENLRFLRDHHPFYFNPLALQKIRIRTDEDELTLGRESARSPWRVVKPLDLATDQEAIKTLIEGLYELQATRILDRASVTRPATGGLTSSRQIAITSFGSDTDTLLEILPPETPEATEVRATVNDRPDTVFNLPLKPEAEMVSLADLPLSVNDLRDATLTHLNVKTLRGILIEPATGTEILISRSPPQPWMATIDGKTQEANEERLFTLLKTVTDAKVTGFETDAATDFTPWGIDRPILRLRFLGETDAQVIELSFGIDGKGGFFVNRTGTPTVMRVDRALVDSIPRRAYEWRPSRLWSIDRINLMAVERKVSTGSPLLLRYEFAKPDPWTATLDGKDMTSWLNPTRANYMLDALEGLKATRWLPPDDASALDALAHPSLTIKYVEKATDDFGDPNGEIITREVALAPGSGATNPAFYYGRMKSDMSPFLMDRATYGRLATELLEKQ